MKVLSIGNSFSQDAHRYLHRLAKADGTDLKSVNLYIGGCSLQRHYINMLDDVPGYDFEFNGEPTGIKVSIRQALISDTWDYVTVQQASHFSGEYDTYTPYIEQLAAYVRKYCPKAKLYVLQTWAYEEGCSRITERTPFQTASEMYGALCHAYRAAARDIAADGIVPCGDAMMYAARNSAFQLHRDTFHASRGLGRYLLSLCLYKTFTAKDISQNSFEEFDVPVSAEERALAISAVNAAFEKE